MVGNWKSGGAARGKAIRQIAKDWKIAHFYDVGRGGHGHIFPMEAGLVRPGMFLFAYDMHCTNFGAIGALALRTGSEVTAVLATGTLWTKVPPVIRVVLSGAFAPGAFARDLGLMLARDLSSGALGVNPDYRALEFEGPGLATLPLAERIALCNTVTEIGVCATFFAPDAAILEWCARRAKAPFEPVYSDADADYEANIEIDLSRISPQVALPGAPERAADLAGVEGTAIQHAYIGSCGSGTYEDLEVAARYLRGRRVAPGTRLFITPGTEESARRITENGLASAFMQAGAMILPAGCGPCAGGAMGLVAPGETSISTAATNTFGRMGARDADLYLASPATVAASAVEGRIVDPRKAHDPQEA